MVDAAVVDTSRWLWITPEVREEASTGALVYSMGLAGAVAALPVAVTMLGVGGNSAAGTSIGYELVPGKLRGGWRSFFSPLPNLAYATRLPAFVASLERLLERRWDVIVVDGLQVGWSMSFVRAHHQGPTVFIAHNHEATLRAEVAAEANWGSPKRAALWLDARKAGRLERFDARRADVVTAITEEDRERFERDAPDSSHITITPGWSGGRPSRCTPIADRPRRAGILGSFNWHVKQENLRRFVKVADPVFAEAGVELAIGGTVPDGFREEIEVAARSVRFVGWVDDVGEFLDTCRLGVLAEPLGGGFKLKALDYVFNGVPLAGLAGNSTGLPLVDERSMLEAATLSELAHDIVDSIDDDERLAALADAALATCSPLFAWDLRARQLREALTAST